MEALKNIVDLPNIDQLIRNMQGMALLDAIIMPEWEHRYFSFDSNWSKDEMMGSIRDGVGAECFIHFSKFGAAGKVLLDSSLPSVSETLKKIPMEFSDFVNEPAFTVSEASFFFWKRYSDNHWSGYPDNLDKYGWLGTLKNGLPSYQAWAEYYYEKSFPSKALESVYNNFSVTKEHITEINSEISLSDLQEDISEILGVG